MSDLWLYQGRQIHGWFGHGTKPNDDQSRRDVVGSLDQRIASMPPSIVAALPVRLRGHPSARFEGPAAGDFTQAMSGWVSAIPLGEADFAARYFGMGPDAPGIVRFRNAASIVTGAQSFADMRDATDEVAAGMQAIGMDRWPAVLRDASARARNGESPMPNPDPGEAIRVSSLGFVRISGGSLDLLAGPPPAPLDVYIPEIPEIEQKIIAITEVVKDAANIILARPMSARAIGTMLHTMFKTAVDEAIARGELPPEVRTEVTWANGEDKRYGEKGAFRTDVTLTKDEKFVAIWDYKTGAGPTILERRVDDLRRAVTEGDNGRTVYFKVLHVPFYGPGL